MHCQACGHDNPPANRFCGGCGTTLSRACPSCQHENAPDHSFCGACGAELRSAPSSLPKRSPRDYTPKHLADKILRSKSAMEGERKQVTVLFVDLQGSMDAAEQLDPESWHQVLDRFFQILTDGVHRFEGTVNQYTGDGIMALFGAPIAHEDHPQRACYAALQLQEGLEREAREVMREHGVSLAARIGIHSGDVVVGKIGDDLRMDYTAQGHTVGLAARMESLASPGTVYLSERTASRVSGYFDLEDLGAFPVKGVKEPIGVFKLRGLGDLKTRFDVSRSRGLTRFVGRERDMETLDAALEQARRSNGQVVGIVAEAGTGKSRLCFEFVERCRVQGLRVLEGHCAAHGRNVPFLPILQVFRAYYGISEHDDDRTARERVAGRMLLLDEGFRDVLPIVFDFFGVADPDQPSPTMDPEARQRQLFEVLRKMMRDDEQEEPNVILVDDLHWIDGGSEVFLRQMAESIADTKNLLLVNFRPEYRGDWTHLSWYRQMPLAPLGPEAIAELLEDLLGGDESLSGLPEKIHARTTGNPFFTEEVVQGLIESKQLEGSRGAYKMATPIDRLEIPDTVQSILSARIDRLLEREKRVLQTAAVIGREFSEPILEAVVEFARDVLREALEQLKTGEFIHAESLYPITEYAFKHPLTQEVALNSQLQDRRRDVHGAVARAIETASGEKTDEQAALLAHHWEEAGNMPNAALWHGRAAEWAGMTDIVEATRHWRRMREILEIGSSPEADALLLDACHGLLSFLWRAGDTTVEELDEILAEGQSACDRLGDEAKRGAMMQTYARGLVSLGDLPRYAKLAYEQYKNADKFEDLSIQANALLIASDAAVWTGDFEYCCEIADEYLERYPHDPAFGAEIWGVGLYQVENVIRGAAYAALGRFDDAEKDLYEAMEVSRPRNEPEMEVWARNWLAEMASHRGVPSVTAKEVARLQAACERAGNPPHLVVYKSRSLALSQVLSGDYAAAVTSAREALELQRQKRVELMMAPEFHALLAEGLCGLGEYDEALEEAELAVRVAAGAGRVLIEANARSVHALALAHVKGEEGRAAIEETLRIAEERLNTCGSLPWKAHLHERRARVAQILGDPHEAHLRAAEEAFEKLGLSARSDRITQELAP